MKFVRCVQRNNIIFTYCMEPSDDNEPKLDEIIEKLLFAEEKLRRSNSLSRSRSDISEKYILDPLGDLIDKIQKYKNPYMDRRPTPTPNRDKIEYRFNELLKNIDLSELSYGDDFRDEIRSEITQLKRDFFNIYDSSEPNYDSGVGGKRKTRKSRKTRKFRKTRKSRK